MKIEDAGDLIVGPTGSIRGHRNRVIRSIQKLGSLSSRSGAGSSCGSSAASDTDSEASSSSFSDVTLSFTTSSSESSTILSFEAEDTDVIRSLREKWQRSKNDNERGDQRSSRNKNDEVEDKVILYTTSIGVIRCTFDASNKLRAILDQNFIRFEERDLFLDESFRRELKTKFDVHHITVPCVFVNDVFFGSLEEIEAMNEAGILRHILPSLVLCDDVRDEALSPGQGMTQKNNPTKRYIVNKKSMCGACGGARFIPCTRCNGSTKSCVLRFPKSKQSIVSLKCSQCSRGTGLIRCPLCFTDDHKLRSSSPPPVPSPVISSASLV